MDILNRKGQLQIQETILVVFIFIILIIFGMVFFYKVQSASIADDFNKFDRERSAIDFITLGDLPEFSCSRAGVREQCIDILKLTAFIDLSKGKVDSSKNKYKDYYFDRFGYVNITIYQIYPNRNNIECSASRTSECGVWSVYSKKPDKMLSKVVYDTPVSLYFPCSGTECEDNYAIGLMIVEAYNV